MGEKVECFRGEENIPQVLWRYFGVFGLQTDSAIRRFQTHYGLPVDGIVGPETKSNFYHAVYHRFHNSHRIICSEETQQKIKNINLQ